MPLTSGIIAPSTFRIPEESQFLKELRKEEEEETELVKELREVIDVTQDDYDNKCQECCALEEDWANLMDFTSSLTGSPCDPEDIKDYINCVNSMVTELKKENEKLKRANEINAELWDTSEKCIEGLEKENKTRKDIHNGDMKIAIMLKENWNEEQEKNKGLKKEIKNLKTNEKVREELIVDMKAEITYLKKEEEEEDNKAFVKDIVKDIIDNAISKTTMEKV